MPERDDIAFGRRLISNSVTLKVVFVKEKNLSGGPVFFLKVKRFLPMFNRIPKNLHLQQVPCFRLA